MRTTSITAMLLVVCLGSIRAGAGEGCCACCGSTAVCQKVCRQVPEEKKVEVICWGCQCEEFCVRDPSCRGCQHCEEVCGECDPSGKPSDVSACPKRFLWIEWSPCSAKVFTKKKLMKKVVTKKVPGFKWVVEDLCAECAAKTAPSEPSPANPPPEEVRPKNPLPAPPKEKDLPKPSKADADRKPSGLAAIFRR